MLKGVVRGMPDRRPRTVSRMFRLPVGIPTDIIQRASGLTIRKKCLKKRSRGSGPVDAVRTSLMGLSYRLWQSLLFDDPKRRFGAPAEELAGGLSPQDACRGDLLGLVTPTR